MEDKVTVDVAAEIIGVSTVQVRKYIKDKLLFSERIGVSHLLDRKAVESFVRPDKGRPPELGKKLLKEKVAAGVIESLDAHAKRLGLKRGDALARVIVIGIENDSTAKPKKK